MRRGLRRGFGVACGRGVVASPNLYLVLSNASVSYGHPW